MRRWRDARVYSATLTFTTMGGLLGLAWAWRADWHGARSSRRPGGDSGALARIGRRGFLVAGPRVVLLQEARPAIGRPGAPLLTHGAIWSAVGAIGGLAFGLGLGGRGRWKATLVRGLVGAAAATVVYETRRGTRLRVQQDRPPAFILEHGTRRWPYCWSRACQRSGRSWPCVNPRSRQREHLCRPHDERSSPGRVQRAESLRPRQDQPPTKTAVSGVSRRGRFCSSSQPSKPARLNSCRN